MLSLSIELRKSLSPPPALDATSVHVWQVDVLPASSGDALMLSTDEQKRAKAFQAERDRARYIVSHVALRSILARYLSWPPSKIRYQAGPHGKPSLLESGGLEFSLARSGTVALIAVCQGARIGVDIELKRFNQATSNALAPDLLALARHYFSPDERRTLSLLPIAGQASAFYRIWTRKQAYIKASGNFGSNSSLVDFSVSVGEMPRLLRDTGNTAAVSRFTLTDGPDDDPNSASYASAVAVERPRCKFIWLDWHPDAH